MGEAVKHYKANLKQMAWYRLANAVRLVTMHITIEDKEFSDIRLI